MRNIICKVLGVARLPLLGGAYKCGGAVCLPVQRSYVSRAYLHKVGKEPLRYRTIGEQLYRAVEKFGQQPAVISCHEHRTLTFEATCEEAEQLAVKLRNLGLQQGEHVAVWAPSTIQWYVTFMASALAGCPLVCLNPALQAPEMLYALKKAKVRALITMDECGKQNFYEILKAILPGVRSHAELIADAQLPELRRVLVKTANGRSMNEFLDYDHVLQSPTLPEDRAHLRAQVREISPDAIFNIHFTSGTTGLPKAALLSHFNYVNEGYQFGPYLKMRGQQQRICLTVPLFHAFGIAVTVSALTYGSTLVLPSPTFNGAAALDAIEHEECTQVVGTPTMYVDMLETQLKSARRLHSLKTGLVGGAACTPEVFHQAKAVLGFTEMNIGYGMTETSAAIFAQDGTEPDHEAPHTVGKAFPYVEAKVINSKGDTVAFGEPGELCIRGFYKMQGYLDDEQKTKEVLLADGWLRTGDEFILEATGTARIIGRKKDMIIRGGENIFPKEIEDFLETDSRILEAQVIGVPDRRMGEEVCAYLRLKEGVQPLTAEDLRGICKGKLAHFKIPKYVRIVDEFPKTSSGKIQKFVLRQKFEEQECTN